MSIRNIEESKHLRKYCEILGREGVALRIIEICKQVAKDKHYKKAVKACGQLRAISIGCKWDNYWDEKNMGGYYEELRKAEASSSISKKENKEKK